MLNVDIYILCLITFLGGFWSVCCVVCYNVTVWEEKLHQKPLDCIHQAAEKQADINIKVFPTSHVSQNSSSSSALL